MRSGLGTGNETSTAQRIQFIQTSMGLLKVFSEEAIKTASDYAVGVDRATVGEDDMKKALMYQARMFFQSVEDLDGRVEVAARQYLETQARGDDDNDEEGEEDEEEDDDESEEESEEGEEGEQAEGAEAAEEHDAAADEDETASVTSLTASTVSIPSVSPSSASSAIASSAIASAVAAAPQGEIVRDEAELQRCRAIARRVDAIAASWHLYEPEDAVLRMIKNAIDATPTAGGAGSGAEAASNKKRRVS